MTKILCRTRQQARQMAEGGSEYYISSCEASDMNRTFPEDDKVLQNAFGAEREQVMKKLREYIIGRIESLGNRNLYQIGYYRDKDEIADRLSELKYLSEAMGIEVGPAHSFNILI